MKARYIALIGIGVVAGLLLAPRKGSESYSQLKGKVNDLYLQAKELDIDTIKDKIYDIKIEVAKMDATRSKELVSQHARIIKRKLSKLITDLQNNKNIQPNMAGAIDATEKVIIDVIDYIDENELIDKTKEQAQKAYDKTSEFAGTIKDKSGDVAAEVKEHAQKVYDKATGYSNDITDDVVDVAQDIKEEAAEVKKEAVKEVKEKMKKPKAKAKKSED